MHGSERMLQITSTRSDLNFRGYVDLDRFGLYERRNNLNWNNETRSEYI